MMYVCNMHVAIYSRPEGTFSNEVGTSCLNLSPWKRLDSHTKFQHQQNLLQNLPPDLNLVHSVSYYYAVLPFYDVKCLCYGGRE